MSEAGFVYVMFNPALKGLVKIGRTGRDPQSRAAELSSATGVPTPFELVYCACFADAPAVEAFIHTALTQRGFRRASNREFFEMPLNDAVRALVAAESMFEAAHSIDESEESASIESSDLDDICELADSLLAGYDDTLQDVERATELYGKAAYAGSDRALLSLAEATITHGVSVDWKKLRPALESAKDRGVVEAAGYLAIAMSHQFGHEPNADKCWRWLLARFDKLPEYSRISWGIYYFIFAPEQYGEDEHGVAVLQAYRDQLLADIKENYPHLSGKVISMLFPEHASSLSGLPRQSGVIVGLAGYGGVMIDSRSRVYEAEQGDLTRPMKPGQSVTFVVDPVTSKARVVRPY